MDRSLRQGWWFLNGRQLRFLQIATVPALVWLVLKCAPDHVLRLMEGLSFASMIDPDRIAGSMVIMFGALWFRFSIRDGRPQKPLMERVCARLHPGVLVRLFLRSILIVTGVSLLVTLPTMLLALGWILLTRQPAVTPQVAAEAVAVAFPMAMILLSPLLVRLYAYYGAVVAGRHDVSPIDAWRWMRGKSLAFLTLLLAVLTPAMGLLTAIDQLGLGTAGYAAAMPVLFISVALVASASARAMNDLVTVPIQPGQPVETVRYSHEGRGARPN